MQVPRQLRNFREPRRKFQCASCRAANERLAVRDRSRTKFRSAQSADTRSFPINRTTHYHRAQCKPTWHVPFPSGGHMQIADNDVTGLLKALRRGDREAAEKLFPLVYAELHRLAAAYMRRERADHTLRPRSFTMRTCASPTPRSTGRAAHISSPSRLMPCAASSWTTPAPTMHHPRWRPATDRVGRCAGHSRAALSGVYRPG